MTSNLQHWIKNRVSLNTLILLLLFVVALGVRLIYLQQFSEYPTFRHLNIDQEYYNLWGKKILAEGLIGKDVYEMTPLYAYFLAFVYKFISTDLYTVRIIQALFGSLTIVYIYRLALLLFNSRRIGIIAGLAGAFYGLFIMNDAMVMKPFLATFFSVMALYWLVKLTESKAKAFIIPGLLVGLMILVRENALLLVGGIPLCFFIQRGIGVTALKRSIFFGIGVALMILPVTLRNYAVSGEFIPVTAGGGEVFYMAYYEGSNGYYVPPDFIYTANPLAEHEEFRQEAMKRTGKKMSYMESSDYWSNEGFKFVKNEPGRMAYLLYRKFLVFWNFYETPDNQNVYFMSTLSSVIRYSLGFGLVAPLGILGIIISIRQWRKLLIVYAFFLAYMASVLITFYISRYRIPTLPILIIFAALYVDWLYVRLRRKMMRSAGITVAVLVLLFFVVNHRVDGVEPYKDYFPTEYTKLGKSYMLEGNTEGAKEAYQKIVDMRPDFFAGHMGLGKIALKQGQLKEAAVHFTNAIKVNPRDHRGYLSLAITYNRLGMTKEAQAMLNRATSLNRGLWGKQ